MQTVYRYIVKIYYPTLEYMRFKRFEKSRENILDDKYPGFSKTVNFEIIKNYKSSFHYVETK